MKLYPIAVDLRNTICVIIGLGKVGRRKLTRLLDLGTSGPKCIRLFDPDPCATQAITAPNIEKYQRSAQTTDLEDADLVFAATSDSAYNRKIAAFCTQHHILVNTASEPENATFQLPALISCDPLQLTIATAGASPALAKKWRRELEEWAQSKRAITLFFARLRPLVLQIPGDHSELFTLLAQGELESLFQKGDYDQILHYLRTNLPQKIANALPEILNDLV